MDVAGHIMRCYKSKVTSLIDNHLVPFFSMTIQTFSSESQAHLLQNALCFFDDYIEYGSLEIPNETIVPQINALAEKYLQILHTMFSDRDIVQCVGFGLGVFAQRLPLGQFKELSTCLNALDKVVGEADARQDDDKVISTENCIGAVGKCLYYHYDQKTVTNNTATYFLKQLPLVADDEEAP